MYYTKPYAGQLQIFSQYVKYVFDFIILQEQHMIEGVIIKELTTHSDKRGFFREIIRKSDDFFSEGFGQWSHSLMLNGVIKAWHLHKIQTDWWYVCSGVLRVGLCDMREDCSTYKQTMEFLMGDMQPCQVLGQSICYILLPIHIIRMTNFE
jgi:dTDP-4-dehydrorhamnose 3,5-epimerase